MRHRCPLSLQTDWHPGEDIRDAAIQIGARKQLGAGRKLRSRLLLEQSKRSAWAEITDSSLEQLGLEFRSLVLRLCRARLGCVE